MIKRIFFVLVLVFAGACDSGDDITMPVQNDQGTNDPGNGGNGGGSGGGGTGGGGTTDDPDGDGVESPVELTDNTDPQDPCSFLLSSQDYSITSQDWRDIDCDGDGVTNKNEVDPDGNGVNNNNGTDPLDPCSLRWQSQTLPTSAEWKLLNCDNDCFTNGTEDEMGTNPTVPTLETIGPYLSKVYNFKTFDGYQLFENNGTLYMGYRTSAFGAIETFYSYIGDKLDLLEARETDQGTLYYVDFDYNGDQISSIDVYGYTLLVSYENNIITSVHPPSSPPGLFHAMVEIDPTTENVVRFEKYEQVSGTNYNYFVYNYIYDSNGDNLIERTVEQQTYDSDTQEYQFVESYSQVFEYYENVLNPAREAFKKLEIPHLLVERTTGDGVTGGFMWNVEMTNTSKNLLRKSTNASPYSGEYFTDLCAETEGRPRILYEGWWGVIFNYSN